MPEDMSEYMPEDMSDRMPEDMSEYMPEDMPDRMPDWMPEDMLDRVPEDMPDRMPEDLPDRMPEDMPDHMPEDMPDRMSNRMSEDMSDRMPEDLPVRKCINVMVGITRSKVIYFPYIGNNTPIWLIFFRGAETTNQQDLQRIVPVVPGQSASSIHFWHPACCSYCSSSRFSRQCDHSGCR